jgi:hypothetical protein
MRLGAVAVVVLVVLAGCSGMGGGVNGTEGDETETGTATATPTATVAPPEGEIVAFEDLGGRGQEAFLDALENGSVRFAPVPSDLDGYPNNVGRQFRCVDYVRYEGRYYEVDFDRGRTYISREFRLRRVTPPENATVADFQNFSERGKEMFRDAVADFEYDTGYGGAVGVFENTYIRYQNQTYRVERGVIADGPSYSLSVERYDPDDSDSGEEC